ncbi:phosphate ABC transporter permease PstA [uncultured Microbacterium sp.]|uniref:phosphate ABC transporter permease PstA n=1 Tax=uncultured Microbacterium sp. TaxID=191216 RepID=UPI0035CA3940
MATVLDALPLTEAEPDTVLPRSVLPERPPEAEPLRTGFHRDDTITLLSSAGAAIGIGLLLSLGLGVIGIGWAPIVAFAVFVLVYTVMVFLGNPGPAVRDRFWTIMLWSAGIAVLSALVLVIGFTVIRGGNVFAQMFADNGQSPWDRLHFFTQDMGGVGPLSGLDEGGILHAIVGTLIQISIALLITIPLGLLTAVFLGEVGGKFARVVRTVVEAMTALPSVVAGLFIYAAIIIGITREPNGFAASLAITVLMLPIMIRSADIVLRLVPGNLREGALALGGGQWRVVWKVVLPTVRQGLVTAIILATAHGIGETAPVLLTAGVTSNLNFNPFNEPMASLPLTALEFVRSPQPTMIARGFATATTLLVIVLVLFLIARAIGGQDAGATSPGQLATLARRSEATLHRMQELPIRLAERAARAEANHPARDEHIERLLAMNPPEAARRPATDRQDTDR